MARDMMPGDEYDGVQYDTEYAPSAAQLEADEIRREILQASAARRADESAQRLARYAHGQVGYRLLG